MATDRELSALLKRILEAPSPFNRARLAAAHITHAAAVDRRTLHRVPLTRREELLRDQLDHLPHGTGRCADAAPPVRAGVTGSGDALLVLTWSAADLARERAAGARLFRHLGVQAGMPVANTLRGALATPGALLVGDVIEEIGGLDVPLGVVENAAAARQAWELIDRVRPVVMILDDESALRLFADVPAASRPWWHGIVWLRTPGMTTAPAAVPSGAGFAGWQRQWLAVPEATSFVGSTCSAGRMHVDDGVVAELVAADGAVVSEGWLALTPLGGDAPVLRYFTDLRARAYTTPCACRAAEMGIELL